MAARAGTKQAEKSEQTRIRLMDAALDVIAKEGWAGASTAKISELANVSRGAQTHHFPTKSALLLAALERTTWLYEAGVRERMIALDPADRTLRALLDIFWEGFVDDRFNQSGVEALVSARTDPDLKDAVADLDTRAVSAMRALATHVTEPAAELEALETAVEMSMYYFRGLVIQRGLHDYPAHLDDLFNTWCVTIERSLGTETTAR